MLDLSAILFISLAEITSVNLKSREEASALLGRELPVGTFGLILRGNDLTHVVGVLVRGSPVSYVKLSASAIIMPLRQAELSASLADIEVQVDSGPSSGVSLKYSLSADAPFNTGRRKLIAQFLKVLFTSNGVNKHNGKFLQGGGARALVGKAFASVQQMQVEAAQCVARASEILSSSQDSSVPNSERLLTAVITSIHPTIGDPSRLNITIQLISKDGATSPLSVGLRA